MRCPLLMGKYNRVCKAVGIILSPGPEEIASLCDTDNHPNCQIYQNYLRTGHKLGLHDYCSIKSPEMDTKSMGLQPDK